jgi:hypothetical protein
MGYNPTTKSHGRLSPKTPSAAQVNERLNFTGVRSGTYLQPQVEQDSLRAFSTASRVSPVRF